MSALSHDTARCMGMSVQHASQPQADWCPQRETCARYVLRYGAAGPRTPFTLWACPPGGFAAKIESEAA